MSSYYPAGSMRGSGIYSYDFEVAEAFCEDDDCGFEGAVTAHVDDWGHAQWECPECGHTHDVAEPDDDFEPPSVYDYDPDDLVGFGGRDR